MKTISSRLVAFSSIAIVVCAMIISPVSALGVSRITPDQSNTQRCTKLKTLAEANEAKMSERLSAMQLDFQKRLTSVSSRHDMVDQKATTFRAERSDRFEAKVAALRNKDGLTDAQLAAIDEFEVTIKTAEKTRETAVDTARATYREALDQVIAEHQGTLLDAATVFQKAVKAALTTAQANCGDTSATVSLRASIKTARDSFQSTRKTDAIKTTIKQLAETRREAVQAANTEFKTSVTTAASALKMALENNDNS